MALNAARRLLASGSGLPRSWTSADRDPRGISKDNSPLHHLIPPEVLLYRVNMLPDCVFEHLQTAIDFHDGDCDRWPANRRSG
jgi:hypothetical protein